MILCLNIEIEKHEFLRVVVIVRWKYYVGKGVFLFIRGDKYIKRLFVWRIIHFDL